MSRYINQNKVSVYNRVHELHYSLCISMHLGNFCVAGYNTTIVHCMYIYNCIPFSMLDYDHIDVYCETCKFNKIN